MQSTLEHVIARMQKYQDGPEKKKRLDEALLKMTVKDLQPLSLVENEGFKQLVSLLDPRYTPPSRRDLVRTQLLPYMKNRKC